MLLYTENRLFYIWNAIVMVCAIFMALYIPLNLRIDLDSSIAFRSIYGVSSVVFIADAIVQFFRHRSEGEGTRKQKAVQFVAWLGIDFVAAIPFGFISGSGALQLLHLVKLVRVAAFIRRFRLTEVRFLIGMTLISFLFWGALLIHWLCCGWMAVYGIDPGADAFTNYVSSLYWVVTTLTSVGYGDIVPVTNAQRLYSILVQLTGIGIFGYLIGNVVSIVSRADAEKARYTENIELFTTAVKRRSLPHDLQKRILDYYIYLREEKMGYDESAFLRSLPESLRVEAALELKKEFIEGIPIFKNASEKFIIEIAPKLELIVVTPGDYLFLAGDPGHEMYFIISGELEVTSSAGEEIATLKEGDFFGEIALFKSQPRTATVKANTYCNLYKLSKDTFDEVIAGHPEIANQIKEKAKVRQERDLSQ